MSKTKKSNNTPNNNDLVRVVGTGKTIASHIVKYLAQYSADMVLAGITGIVIEINNADTIIRYEKRQSQAKYSINITTDLALKFNRAMDFIENHPELRKSIKDRALQELDGHLDEIYHQVRVELSHNPYA